MNPTPHPVINTEPVNRVLSLTSLKNFLRVDTTDDDALLNLQLRAAERRLESELGVKFVNQTWDIYYDCFPHERMPDDWWDGTKQGPLTSLYSNKGGYLFLPFGPLSDLTGVYSYSEDDTQYIFPASAYSVDSASKRGRIGLKSGEVWPSTVLRPVNGVKVTATFGYGVGYNSEGDSTDIPEDIQEAVKQFAAKLYEHRGDEIPVIPPSVLMLVDHYRGYRI